MGRRVAERVLLIGWDAADWQMIRPLIDRGLMPTLAKLIEGGVSGNLATLQPALSPMLWNSIATGKRADKHGICGFLEPKPDRSGLRPVSSTSRKCKAIWNILSQCGLTSQVVSWFASHPAEPIRGTVVSDRYVNQVRAGQSERIFPEGTFHPASLAEELGPLLVRPADIEADALLPFIPRAAEIDQRTDDRLIKLASVIARASTSHAAACRLIVERPWDFMAVYYPAIDEFGHFFMPYHPPLVNGISPQDCEIYRDVMVGCYRFHDMMLDTLLAYAGPDTTVMLVSDHGFQSGKHRPSANAWEQPERWHRQFGIACVHGPGIRRNESLFGATLLDVTPTILAMFGLPIGNDMDGRPWLEIFAPPVSVQRIESWESVSGEAGLHDDLMREDPSESAEVIRRLVDLGYIEPPSHDTEESIRQVVRDQKINLAVAISASRRIAAAVPLWEELAADYPAEVGFSVQLASCLVRLGRLAEGKCILDRIDGDIKQSPFVRLMLANIALKEHESAESLRLAREILQQSPTEASILNRIGEVFLQAESWDEAESVFRASLEVNDDNAVAHDGLAQVFLERDDFTAAVEPALVAVGLIHFFPAAHFHLGVALHGAGRDEEAIAAFETCLAMGYEPDETHYRLALLYHFRNPAKAQHHREKAGLA